MPPQHTHPAFSLSRSHHFPLRLPPRSSRSCRHHYYASPFAGVLSLVLPLSPPFSGFKFRRILDAVDLPKQYLSFTIWCTRSIPPFGYLSLPSRAVPCLHFSPRRSRILQLSLAQLSRHSLAQLSRHSQSQLSLDLSLLRFGLAQSAKAWLADSASSSQAGSTSPAAVREVLGLKGPSPS